MIQRSDWVRCKSGGGGVGIVRRVARDGSWADVAWRALGHTKRMRAAALDVVTTIPVGDGVAVTDVTREDELAKDESAV